MKIVDYKIVTQCSPYVMQQNVVAQLQQGWVPQGGVYHGHVTLDGKRREMFMQAMVKYED